VAGNEVLVVDAIEVTPLDVVDEDELDDFFSSSSSSSSSSFSLTCRLYSLSFRLSPASF
jgi:hypothetical protein